jgi:hypothetical protein
MGVNFKWLTRSNRMVDCQLASNAELVYAFG